MRHVVLVSPWITHLEFATGDSRKLLQRMAACRTRLTIITRQPEASSEHHDFLVDATAFALTEIFFVPDLHAKYYVCHTTGRSFAVVGSPNMYRWTQRSFEIGIAIEGSGPAESLLSELDSVTYELKTTPTRHVYKKLGAPPCPPR